MVFGGDSRTHYRLVVEVGELPPHLILAECINFNCLPKKELELLELNICIKVLRRERDTEINDTSNEERA